MVRIDEEDMPVCPGCGQPIFVWEDSEIAQVGTVKALVCSSCVNSGEEE